MPKGETYEEHATSPEQLLQAYDGILQPSCETYSLKANVVLMLAPPGVISNQRLAPSVSLRMPNVVMDDLCL